MREGIISALKDIFRTALISLGIFLVVYMFLIQPHRVKGDSMLPNFHDGELLLTEKISYRFGMPQRGDVIVFTAPGSRNVDFIKRIIGLPGESITVSNGEVLINNEQLIEPYETQKTRGSINITLSANHYFVLGDNRGSSSDSRSFGPIERKSIKGKAWFVYWPITKSASSGGLRLLLPVDYSIPDPFNNL